MYRITFMLNCLRWEICHVNYAKYLGVLMANNFSIWLLTDIFYPFIVLGSSIVPRCRNIKVSFLLFSGISTSVMVYKRWYQMWSKKLCENGAGVGRCLVIVWRGKESLVMVKQDKERQMCSGTSWRSCTDRGMWRGNTVLSF